MRLFIALEPDGKTAEKIYGAAKAATSAAVPPEKLHATLRFIGEADPEAFAGVLDGCRNFNEIISAPIEVRKLSGATAIIYESAGADKLAKLVGSSRFLPHITVTRKQCDERKLSDSLRDIGVARFTAVSLMQSRTDTGKYIPLRTVFLRPKLPFKCVLFDLDGTLSNSGPGIIGSVKYALKAMNVTDYDEKVLTKFLGPPLVWSFKTYLGLSDADAEKGLRLYRENYNEQGGKYIAEIYPGVTETLETLKAKGIKMAVATVKPQNTATEVLEHFGLIKYFDYVAGSPPDIKHAEKQTVIMTALNALGLQPGADILMAGDRVFDVESAKALGLSAFGASYGFGGREELKSAGADYVSDRLTELLTLF